MADYRLGKLRRPSVQFPRGQWCVVWNEDGTRRRYGLGVGLHQPESEARRALAEFRIAREAALQNDRVWLIKDLIAAYLEDRRLEGANSRSLESHIGDVVAHFGDMTLADIKRRAIVAGEQRTVFHAYAWDREQKGYARATIRTRLIYLRAALNWAERRRLLGAEGAPYVWAPSSPPPRDVVASEEEVMQMLAKCDKPFLRLFLLLAIATGARRQAILDLTWDRVDLQRGIVDYRIADTGSILVRRRRKGRSVVEIGETLRVILSAAKEQAQSPHVIEAMGRPVPKQTLYVAFRRLVREAQVNPRITPHVLRHSVATWLADRQVDMRKIQKLLGHRDMSITEQVYAKYSRGYLTEAAEALDSALKPRFNEPRHNEQ